MRTLGGPAQVPASAVPQTALTALARPVATARAVVGDPVERAKVVIVVLPVRATPTVTWAGESFQMFRVSTAASSPTPFTWWVVSSWARESRHSAYHPRETTNADRACCSSADTSTNSMALARSRMCVRSTFLGLPLRVTCRFSVTSAEPLKVRIIDPAPSGSANRVC